MFNIVVSNFFAITVALTAGLCGICFFIYEPGAREAFWRLLGQRPLIDPKKRWTLVFKVNAASVTRQDLDVRFRELQQRIRADSHFKTADRHQLGQLYAQALAHIQQRDGAAQAERTDESRDEQGDPVNAQERLQDRALIVLEGQRWRRLLEVDPQEADPLVIKRAYRRKALEAHPDRGGSHDAMAKVNAAYTSAKRELSFH